MTEEKARGTLFIVSAPSGAGKTSLVRALTSTMPDIRISVSHTTRAPRPGEQDGMHYYFVAQADFDAMLAQGLFLEYARVFDHCYGTSRAAVLEALARGVDIILEIDWQGARQVREKFPDCVSVFILPPSREVLAHRLRARGQDSEQVIARRMQGAVAEMRHYDEYNYLIVNDDFDIALSHLRALITARRLRLEVQCGRHAAMLADLLA